MDISGLVAEEKLHQLKTAWASSVDIPRIVSKILAIARASSSCWSSCQSESQASWLLADAIGTRNVEGTICAMYPNSLQEALQSCPHNPSQNVGQTATPPCCMCLIGSRSRASSRSLQALKNAAGLDLQVLPVASSKECAICSESIESAMKAGKVCSLN